MNNNRPSLLPSSLEQLEGGDADSIRNMPIIESRIYLPSGACMHAEEDAV